MECAFGSGGKVDGMTSGASANGWIGVLELLFLVLLKIPIFIFV
jgi:hypothetical protein